MTPEFTGEPVVPAARETDTVTMDPDLQARLDKMRAEQLEKERFRQRVWRERRVLFPMLALVLVSFFNFGRAEVVGNSMLPQYHSGDSLLLLKSYRRFAPLDSGDIVVLQLKHGKLAGQDLVKRVVFIQNTQGTAKWPETVETSRGNIPTRLLFPLEAAGIAPTPPNSIWVVGDNLMNSTDSRDFGPVSRDEVIGKVLR